MHAIVLAVNNPPADLVNGVVNSHLGGGWKAVWCADTAALSQLPPPTGRICYVVVGTSGSLTLSDIREHLHRDRRDIAVWGPGARAFGL